MTWSLTPTGLPRVRALSKPHQCRKNNKKLKNPPKIKSHPERTLNFRSQSELFLTPGVGKQRGGTKEQHCSN